VEDSGEGRSINRHDFTTREIDAAIRRPVVRRVLDLVRLRHTHPAFAGRLAVSTSGDSTMRLAWEHGDDACELDVDLGSGRTVISGRRDGIEHRARP
jgi:hypothetical protein